MIKIRDTWFRIAVVLIPFMLVGYTNSLWTDFTITRLFKVFVSLVSIILITEGTRYICYNSRRWVPHNKVRRIVLVFVIGLSWTTLVLAISTICRKYLQTGSMDLQTTMDTNVILNDKKLTFGILWYSFFNAIVNFSFLLLGFDIFYHYAKLRHTEMDRERLEKEKLRAELQQLKGIINPHFLFNNLNSLSSLISEDPVRAESFLDELTKVFRYLLRNNETEVTTLAQELQFIQSYYHLLQTRYGKAIILEMDISEEYRTWLIPPLTLQLLVENAFKHNQLNADNPLKISMYTTIDKRLLVKNTICKRQGQVDSTGIGLQNINARYAMLNHTGLVIEKDEQYFSVAITLIKPA